MTILLENVYDALSAEIIDQEQALYILYVHNNMTYPISPIKLLELGKLKYIVANRVGKVLYQSVSPISDKLTGTIAAIYKTQISKEIPKRICRMVCEKDLITGKLRLPGTEDTLEHTAKAYLKGEGLIAYHYIIFLFMFPTVGESNKRWEKHFTGFPYTGARIRVRSGASANKFKQIAKKRDMGVFLYGTYLFMQSCIRGDKTFVKTIRNYLTEYVEWYDMANEAINNARSVDDLFKKRAINKEGRLNMAF